MVKFTLKGKDDRVLVGLGITAGNVEKLKQGLPIIVKGEDINLEEPMDIMIFYGENEQVIADNLKPFIDPSTIVKKY